MGGSISGVTMSQHPQNFHGTPPMTIWFEFYSDQIWHGNTWMKGMFLGESAMPHPKGLGLRAPIFWTSLCTPAGYDTQQPNLAL